jgi:hypothetical protein
MTEFNTQQYKLGFEQIEAILNLLELIATDIERKTSAPPKASAAAALQILISTCQSFMNKMAEEESESERPN